MGIFSVLLTRPSMTTVGPSLSFLRSPPTGISGAPETWNGPSTLEDVPSCCEPIMSTRDDNPVTSEAKTNSFRSGVDISPA